MCTKMAINMNFTVLMAQAIYVFYDKIMLYLNCLNIWH